MTIETPDQAASTLPILSHWIGGRRAEVAPEQTGPVYNPATGEVIARVPRGGAAEVDAAVAAARAAFPAWRDMPLIARSAIFFAYREQLWRHREELAALITRDHGKTFPDALAEVTRGMETVEFACGLPVHLAGLNTPNVSTKVDAHTLRGPLGVAAGITPFNFPAMVPMWIYPIAIACGNTFIWKPSSHTPGATQLQAELWREAGLPDGVFNVVYGGREAVSAICEHPGIDAIQFVGSTPVGRYVYETGTRAHKRVGAYTAAKNAMIVLPDADLDLAADSAVAAGYGSAGERCMAQTLVIAVGDAATACGPWCSSGSPGSRWARAWSPAWTWGRSTRPSTASRSSPGSTRARPRGPSSSSTAGRSSTPRTPPASSWA